MIGAVNVLFVNVSVVARPTKVSVDVGKVSVPVFTIVAITGAVNVLFVNVSVVALPTKVSVVIGNVNVGVPATAGVTMVAVPDVLPVIATAVVLTDLPAVKLLTATLTVTPDWTIGNTSVPARGVVAAVSAEIFTLAIIF
jgi:hypothetical protein